MFDQNLTSPFTTKSPEQQQAEQPLSVSVQQAVNKFLKEHSDSNIENLYQLVLAEIEVPLLEEVMAYTRGNQTKAAILMGTNRGTLRKNSKITGLIRP